MTRYFPPSGPGPGCLRRALSEPRPRLETLSLHDVFASGVLERVPADDARGRAVDLPHPVRIGAPEV